MDRQGLSGFANSAVDAAARRRRAFGLVTLVLWVLAMMSAYSAYVARPSGMHTLILVLLMALFVVVHVQATLAAWAASRDWRRMLALLYSARYLSEVKGMPARDAFLLELEREMRASRNGGSACTLVTIRFASLDAIREMAGDRFTHKAVEDLGGRLKRITRGSDLLGYVGDGTFATLLVDCTQGESEQFVRRVPLAFPVESPGGRPQDFPVQVRSREYNGQAEDPVDFLAQVELRQAPLTRMAAQRAPMARGA